MSHTHTHTNASEIGIRRFNKKYDNFVGGCLHENTFLAYLCCPPCPIANQILCPLHMEIHFLMLASALAKLFGSGVVACCVEFYMSAVSLTALEKKLLFSAAVSCFSIGAKRDRKYVEFCHQHRLFLRKNEV